MTLKEWFKKYDVKPYLFAKEVKIHHSNLYRYISGERKISRKHAVIIEEATNGEVTREECIWPEETGKVENDQVSI